MKKFNTLLFFLLVSISFGQVVSNEKLEFDKIYSQGNKMQISYEDYIKVDVRVGTVLSVVKNKKARQPAFVLEVDFGREIGIKKSSAKITHYYDSEDLIGKQIIAVCNFPTKNIAGIISEVLILGAVDENEKVVLHHPSQKVENGLKVY